MPAPARVTIRLKNDPRGIGSCSLLLSIIRPEGGHTRLPDQGRFSGRVPAHAISGFQLWGVL
jgi:hypothetical protein